MTTTKWTVDPAHSEILFKVKHLMITNVTGTFTDFSSEAETVDNSFNPATIRFEAKVASINTNNEQRDAHLRSADFFDSDNYPTINFVAEAYNSNENTITGDLTIRGNTQKVRLDVEFGGIQPDPWGNTKAGFSLSGKINRKDFGLTWNAPLEAGGMLVSDEVRLQCEIQLVKNS
ncbi:MAG: YceI family protein [Chitinophagales bacterium]|jgi:polyisoprenoid-binding protein YceI|nr:YceI family protein [Chitinophagales bacterium]